MALASTSLYGAKSIAPPSPPGTTGLRLPADRFALKSYIYNDRTPFEKLPDNLWCPKRRFRAYEPAVNKNVNDTEVRKARKAQIKRDEAIGQALPFAIALGAAALAGLYFYLNSTV
ncbi:hypothetical protein DH2020_018827 [Rehmannia glutinosa]|uniref:Uncharacterized protein n=1 Tax=Rehmannia glutinosa TaxID=99300 RepID=A0ABR0WPH0_REHGL